MTIRGGWMPTFVGMTIRGVWIPVFGGRSVGRWIWGIMGRISRNGEGALVRARPAGGELGMKVAIGYMPGG